MAMGGGDDERGMMAQINVTPLVDVMLVLLGLFMSGLIVVDRMRARLR